VGRWLRGNAWLVLAAGAVLVITRTIDFEPPPEVRVGKREVAQLVGDAPAQEFSAELSNPQAVQLRATLRLYTDAQLEVSSPDPETDAQSKVLSQPVITTILGMNATIEQAVRLDGGALEVDLSLEATPRLAHEPRRGQGAPPIVLEHALVVKSRQDAWWLAQPVRRVHLDSHGFLAKVEDYGQRFVFAVDDQLFSLDLELHRANVAAPVPARGVP
jgi:hypothetical protein